MKPSLRITGLVTLLFVIQAQAGNREECLKFNATGKEAEIKSALDWCVKWAANWEKDGTNPGLVKMGKLPPSDQTKSVKLRIDTAIEKCTAGFKDKSCVDQLGYLANILRFVKASLDPVPAPAKPSLALDPVKPAPVPAPNAPVTAKLDSTTTEIGTALLDKKPALVKLTSASLQALAQAPQSFQYKGANHTVQIQLDQKTTVAGLTAQCLESIKKTGLDQQSIQKFMDSGIFALSPGTQKTSTAISSQTTTIKGKTVTKESQTQSGTDFFTWKLRCAMTPMQDIPVRMLLK